MALAKLKDHGVQEFYPDSKTRAVSQKNKMLQALRKARTDGVTNEVLSQIGYSYHSRISELYAEGYVIAVESLGNGLANYVLVSEPRTKLPKPKKAQDVVLDRVRKLGSVNAEQLQDILEGNEFFVVRKYGAVKPIINIAGK